jgi:hypothetical protein
MFRKLELLADERVWNERFAMCVVGLDQLKLNASEPLALGYRVSDFDRSDKRPAAPRPGACNVIEPRHDTPDPTLGRVLHWL